MAQRAAALALIADARFGFASLPPERGMRSDAHFMEKDYPSDVRAKVTSLHTKYGFDHPYPILQEDHDYDADYVKDENDDGGEWKAQERYDYLRHAYGKYQAEIDRLKAKLAEDERIYREAQAKEARLEAASKAADAAYDAAKKAADVAQDRLDGLRAQVAEAQAAVDKETNELDVCRKELAAAKKTLDHELANHRDEAEAADAANRRAAAAHAAAVDAADAANEAQVDAQADAADDVTNAENKENKAENAVERSKSAIREAQAAYDAALAKVKRTEALLEEAAAKLAKFRNGEDSNGGVYNVLAEKKSTAWRVGGGVAMAVAALAVCSA